MKRRNEGIKEFAQSLKSAFLDLLFPPLCIHCDALLDKNCSIFCTSCLSLLDLLDPNAHCNICFSPILQKNAFCSTCQKSYNSYDNQKWHISASAFEYMGPSASLIRKLKYGGQTFLAKGAASFLYAQLIRLNWPMPDVVVPVPISGSHYFNRGFNQSLLIALELGTYIDRPVREMLGRSSGEFSQAGLSFSQRRKLKEKGFFLSKKIPIQDKIILLIDDVMTTGSTLNACAKILISQFPRSIYSLTVCKTME